MSYLLSSSVHGAIQVSAPWIKDFTLVNGPDYVAYILPWLVAHCIIAVMP